MSRVRNDVWEKTGHNQLPWVNTSLIGEYKLNPQSASEPGAEKTKPAAPPSEFAADPKQAQENLLWESAQHSNLWADYQAYLDAFPGGVFAQMAKNRIASMEGARPPPTRAGAANPRHDGADWPQRRRMEDNVGTVDTERALNLGPAGEKEVQQRLSALDLYTGPKTGAMDRPPGLRSRNGKRRAASRRLRSSIRLSCGAQGGQRDRISEVSCGPASHSAGRAEAPRRELVRPSPKPPVTRAAKPSPPAAPVRRAVKRANPNRPNRGSGCAASSSGSRRKSRLEAESGSAGTADGPRHGRAAPGILARLERRPAVPRALDVSSQTLMAHSYRVIRRMHYGTNSTRERHNDRGGPSSDTT